MVIEESFKQGGLGFIGPLNPTYNVGHAHILIATDYFTKWDEEALVKRTTSEVVSNFLMENISVRFRVREFSKR